MSIGDNLRRLIEERGLTQKELAAQINIAPSTMGCYVNNTREPDFNTLKALAEYFNVTTDYLLDCPSGKAHDFQENELLRVFRTLTFEQREICIDQCKAFTRVGNRKTHYSQEKKPTP